MVGSVLDKPRLGYPQCGERAAFGRERSACPAAIRIPNDAQTIVMLEIRRILSLQFCENPLIEILRLRCSSAKEMCLLQYGLQLNVNLGTAAVNAPADIPPGSAKKDLVDRLGAVSFSSIDSVSIRQDGLLPFRIPSSYSYLRTASLEVVEGAVRGELLYRWTGLRIKR